ncbi:hypothetical protein AXF42_Ash014941 [Apostasia shenzhenica]|uniref:Cystatin domain-containing protein n=1 Tax=Apostasia shenzhenica TaxID=1088818 RepID=A0A2I0ALJ5_9ASPA|nr:hypothetical protein AXF42_Ash014941 [Apostasia shenzhenica]
MAPPPTVLLLAAALAVVILSATAGARKPAAAVPFSGRDGSRAGRIMSDVSNDPNGFVDEDQLSESLGKFTVDHANEAIRLEANWVKNRDNSAILVYEEVVTANIGELDKKGKRRCVLLVKAVGKKSGKEVLIRAHIIVDEHAIADSSKYTMAAWNYEGRPDGMND